jgi:hypothetical protein
VTARKTMVQAILLAAAIAAMPSIAVAQAKIDVPLVLGGSEDVDACEGGGVIVGLNPRGDGFLSVRSGPAGNYSELDRLYNGNTVQICGYRGAWMAVIYPADGTPADGANCGTGRPWPTRQAYTGPCKYGWVSSRYVKGIAG